MDDITLPAVVGAPPAPLSLLAEPAPLLLLLPLLAAPPPFPPNSWPQSCFNIIPRNPPQNHVLCFCVIADYPRGWVPFRSQTRGRHPSPLPETHTKTQSRRKIRRPDDCWFVQHPPKTNASWSSVFLVENEETLPNSNTLPMNLFFRTTPQQFGDLSTEHHPTFKRTCSYARK